MLEETPKWKLRFDLWLDAFLPTEMGYACHFVSIIEHYNLHTTEKVLNSPVLIVVALYMPAYRTLIFFHPLIDHELGCAATQLSTRQMKLWDSSTLIKP